MKMTDIWKSQVVVSGRSGGHGNVTDVEVSPYPGVDNLVPSPYCLHLACSKSKMENDHQTEKWMCVALSRTIDIRRCRDVTASRDS